MTIATTGESAARGGSVGGHGSGQLISLSLWEKELLQLTEAQAHKTSTVSGRQGESPAYLQLGGKHLAVPADLRPQPPLYCTVGRAYTTAVSRSGDTSAPRGSFSRWSTYLSSDTFVLKVQVLWCLMKRHTS